MTCHIHPSLAAAALALASVLGGCGDAPAAAPEDQRPDKPVASAPAGDGPITTAPAPATAASPPRLVWSEEAKTLARHTLDAVRGPQHEAAVTIVWPDAPLAPPPAKSRIVLVGGAAGHADETLTVIERDADGVWAARGRSVHERISGNGAAAATATDLRLTPEEFDLRFEAARLVRLARFVRTDGKDATASQSAGTDEFLYYVRIDENGASEYERCRENDVLEGGLRAAVGLRHDTLFALFTADLGDAGRAQPLSTARWQGFLEHELARVEPKHLGGSRDGLSRLAQAVVVHAAEGAGPGAVAHLERLGLSQEAQMLRLQTAWDPAWATAFLSRRYDWDREERALARRVRDAYRENDPDGYAAFLANEAATCAKDLDAVHEVVSELALLGQRARPVLGALMRNDDAGVRVDAAVAILAADDGDAEAGAYLESLASDPAATGAVWRHFDTSPRRVALAHVIDGWDDARVRAQLDRQGEDARVIGILCDVLAARGAPVADEDQVTLYRRAIAGPVSHGTLRAVARLVELDDRESFTPLKDAVGALSKLPSPSGWNTIDESNWRNDLTQIDTKFWKWLTQRRKAQ